MEEITHGVNEDAFRLFPCQWQRHHMGLERYFEAIFVISVAHCQQPSCHSLGVTMFATRADLVTPCYWIPGRIGPFDGGSRGHSGFRSFVGSSCLAECSTQGSLYLF